MPQETSPEAALCSTCHRPLLQSGPDGECVRCLFASALLPDEAGWESDVRDASPGATDGARYGQFEILTGEDGSFQELGAGAMGVTYRAQDRVLHRPVALKVISRSYAGDRATRARFLREARAAAQLRHPNVASVHHYGEQDGQCFYAMELVEGETLEARVRREGPLPAPLALEITLQVARALAAAETQGIVHRDLKPSNIMLVAARAENTDGASVVVKVIDFGLAKAVAADTPTLGLADTRGGFVGTPAFASPEQYARVETERVDTRSDIYSLGVTLWYLLCGKLPFVGRTLTEIHEQQVAQPLPSGQLQSAHVPAPVVALLHSMLAVAPAHRPQSARELLEALRRCQRRLLVSSHVRRARLAGAIGLLALVIAGMIAWHEYTRPGVPPQGQSIAVLPFENLSADPADAFFTTGLQDEITADLAHVASLKVISPSSTARYQAGKRDLPAIGKELGVANLLEGSARRDGDRLMITLRLADVRNPSHPWVQRYDRKLADVFAVQGEIARVVADRLQVTLSPDEKAIINRPPTTDLTAYQLYMRSGEGSEIMPDESAVRHSAEGHIVLLDQAIARDPNFVLAYCRLAREHDYVWSDSNGATPEELSVDHRALAEIALQKARRLQPDAGEVHLAFAKHLYRLDNGSEQAVIEAELALRALPNNADAESTAAQIYCDLGRWDDAIRSYERAYALDPRGDTKCWSLALTYEALRRYEDFDRMIAATLALVSDDEKTEFTLARTSGPLEGRADLGPLRDALANLHAADHADDSSIAEYSLILRLCEHDADGIDAVLSAGPEVITDADYPYPKAWFAALAARIRGDEAGAQRAFIAARASVAKAVADRPRSASRLSLLAMIDAGLGRKEDAVREARRACEMQPYATDATYAPSLHCNLAVVYAWTDQRDLAIATLAIAVDHPAGENIISQPTYGDLRLNPLWDSLRDDPRFQAFIQKFAPH